MRYAGRGESTFFVLSGAEEQFKVRHLSQFRAVEWGALERLEYAKPVE